MSREYTRALGALLDNLAQLPLSAAEKQQFNLFEKSRLATANATDAIKLFDSVVPFIESAIARQGWPETLLSDYHSASIEHNALYEQLSGDDRFGFTLIIPVADRPAHLRCCLNSLLSLCRLFPYGTQRANTAGKIAVVIADDSRDSDSISQHHDIVTEFCSEGLSVQYFGQQEQLELLADYAPEHTAEYTNIFGSTPAGAFYHKGPSAMRNITYLLLHRLSTQNPNQLFYFLDSDQEFKVRVSVPDGELDVYAINYFYHLNRIFSRTDALFLTGKVVGDPPVSPAVMTGNFLSDISGFLQQLQTLRPHDSCTFHDAEHIDADAAYHDMADLFGFTTAAEAFEFHCNLDGAHDHGDCLANFARQLDHFFDGEHPTRSSYYTYADVEKSIQPARTIYTGNYVMRPEGLAYFIPFSTLRLRMAGPVLGRVLKIAVGERFVSANLPMLHNRTVAQTGQSEFRPGIDRSRRHTDLSGEFERQFYGDVMLFSMEKFTAQRFPLEPPVRNIVVSTLTAVEQEMRKKYLLKQQQIIETLKLLRTVLNNPSAWWQQEQQAQAAVEEISGFLDTIEFNFGAKAPAYALITDAVHRDARLRQMTTAIERYIPDTRYWRTLLGLS